ncbi:diiron oxygenase [Kitasatospora sp. NPDC002227]|uniref:diiron oxygenase n=1 Tax=Kitasatospora sp. NPDC002227 TaxID=3154773 RepID=UPI003329A603
MNDVAPVPTPTLLTRKASPAGLLYESRFKNWDKRASVRVKPERLLGPHDAGRLHFPPELVPVVSHPLVAERPEGTVERMLVQRLHQYLHFTTVLEQSAVMPVTTEIGLGRIGFPLPQEMLQDAFKITTDEAWHAQFSYDLGRQVATATGVPALLPEHPRFVGRLARLGARLDPALRGAEALLFSIISETLISAILSDLPRDRRLPTAVRELVRDHAEDEGRHHAYFRTLLRHFWSELDSRRRESAAAVIPDLVFAFLEPDYDAVRLLLLDAGLGPAEAEGVLADCYPAASVRAGVAAAARSTTRYFTELGALDSARTAEAFAAAGLTA